MSDELKNQFSEFLIKLMDAAQKGVETASAEIPMLLQEIVLWQLWRGGFAAVVFAVLGGLVVWIYVRAVWRRPWFEFRDRDNFFAARIVGGFACIAACGLLLTGFTQAAEQVIKCLVAPRLVIIDYLKGLL